MRKNVEYGLRMKRMRKAERSKIANHWINLVGLTSFADAYPRELSGGMRKRVDLARLYANDPEVMLMDEPFGALDRLTREHMQIELLDLWERKRKTVIFVTHDLDEAIFLSDIVMVMSARPAGEYMP